MRKIDRSAVAAPTKLTQLYANQQNLQDELELIRSGNTKAKSNIYGDLTVKNALVGIYKNVCFLCQVDVSSGYDIEHFLPWSVHYPERAYDWNNLHQSCKPCNNRKKRKEYKVLNDGKVDDIRLLDPSSDNVEVEITFDADNCCAVDLAGNDKSNMTTIFLNDPECLGLRKEHWIRLNKMLISDEWLQVFYLIKTDYKNYLTISLDFTNDIDKKIGDFCYRIAVGYLSLNKAYNVFTSRIFYDNTGIELALIKKYCNEHCGHHHLPVPNMM
ncbi:HNH endonuclease [Aeromonas veronii]|uniref:HNH endonuclease n=1 Tax=Aeromonas veronii TaxID=654 RepID=UPI001F38A4A1|nr:HNH endonuclease [Aeromonas veronii]MCF5760053.1 HNH endonuclease [Aeromonas veronii]